MFRTVRASLQTCLLHRYVLPCPTCHERQTPTQTLTLDLELCSWCQSPAPHGYCPECQLCFCGKISRLPGVCVFCGRVFRPELLAGLVRLGRLSVGELVWFLVFPTLQFVEQWPLERHLSDLAQLVLEY
jgi:hypothetical protein